MDKWPRPGLYAPVEGGFRQGDQDVRVPRLDLVEARMDALEQMVIQGAANLHKNIMEEVIALLAQVTQHSESEVTSSLGVTTEDEERKARNREKQRRWRERQKAKAYEDKHEHIAEAKAAYQEYAGEDE
jgi:hypothetical protein